MVTWAQLRLHNKPVILINTAGYWDGFLAFLDTAVAAGFLKPRNRALLRPAANADEAVRMLVVTNSRLQESDPNSRKQRL
jgi:predicted Rossmann-fold nucleotide-binding protein